MLFYVLLFGEQHLLLKTREWIKLALLTFNGTRFFIGFLSIIPFALLFEKKKIAKEINKNKKLFYKLLFWVGLFLFLGTYVQQAALLYTDVANAAFFTIFYVPMVPIILFLFYSKSLHWSIWPSVLFCFRSLSFK